MYPDQTVLAAFKSQDLRIEADRERLAAQVPQRPSAVRRELALACHRLADWLDHTEHDNVSKRYFQPSESGSTYWARVR
jgi:hypothetical protein